MNKWKAIWGVVVIFLLGAAAGALISYKFCQQKMENIAREEPGSMREFIVRRLSDDLHLDPAQTAQLRTIVQETHAEIRGVRRQYRPRIDEILAQSHAKIRAMLHPDQLEKFERFQKVMEERRKRRENREDGNHP